MNIYNYRLLTTSQLMFPSSDRLFKKRTTIIVGVFCLFFFSPPLFLFLSSHPVSLGVVLWQQKWSKFAPISCFHAGMEKVVCTLVSVLDHSTGQAIPYFCYMVTSIYLKLFPLVWEAWGDVARKITTVFMPFLNCLPWSANFTGFCPVLFKQYCFCLCNLIVHLMGLFFFFFLVGDEGGGEVAKQWVWSHCEHNWVHMI